MLIDWFTVGAQALNFLILVWLLKRLLYKPILDAIDARERRIAAALADADAKKAEALSEREAFERKKAAFDRERAALISQATQEAKAERARLLDMARTEADDLRVKRQEALRSEQQGLSDALTRRAREEVFAIARRALADLAGTTLEQRMTEVFLQRLREQDEAGKAGLKAAFSTSAPLLVRTTYDVSPEHRAAIEAALRDIFGKPLPVNFETAPDQISGIEFSANGHKVAWSIADYLASLAKGVDSLLASPSSPESHSRSETAPGVREHGA